MSANDGITKTRGEQIKSQLHQQVKQHIVYDSPSDKRPRYIFTAPIDAKDGAPCTCTEYVYLETSNTTQVVNRQERDYRWKTAWETAKPFTFDPTDDIDPDGDGYL